MRQIMLTALILVIIISIFISFLLTGDHMMSDEDPADTGGRWRTPGGGPGAPQTVGHGPPGNNVSSLVPSLTS